MALGHVGPPEDGAPVFPVVAHHVQHGQHRTGADAHNGPCRADLQGLSGVDQVSCQGQADHQLEERLDKLADRRRHHVLPSLGEAPVGAHDGYADDRYAQRLDGPIGHGVVHDPGQLLGKQQHGRSPGNAQGHKQRHCGVEAAPHLGPAACGVGLADELAERQGQAGRGQGEQEGVDIIRAHEVGNALVPQDVVERYFIECAADLDEHRGYGHHCDTAHKGLLVFSGHGFPSFTGQNAGRVRPLSESIRCQQGETFPLPVFFCMVSCFSMICGPDLTDRVLYWPISPACS